jgi:phosphatidylserine/phosphatidylglycerophosphate/cardiolipin synthase-like enzyme
MGKLQHNKMIVVDGDTIKRVVCGSTNFSWRGFYVQGNNAILIDGEGPVAMQMEAFESYWSAAATFKGSVAAKWRPLHLDGIDGSIAMSPHSNANAVQQLIGQDIRSAQASVFYSLAFLYQTPGVVTDAISDVTNDPHLFVYGISDKKTKIMVADPGGNPVPVSAAALTKHVPEPFKSEAKGGSGVKMHHKFIVLDFNTPQARVYCGSFNFSSSADTSNGENLLLFKDRKIATSYMVEAVRIFDSYSYRIASENAKKTGEPKTLHFPPSAAGEVAWWDRFYTVPIKVRDRLLFSG